VTPPRSSGSGRGRAAASGGRGRPGGAAKPTRTRAAASAASAASARLDVRRTLKLYVGGEFPRSESGRTYPVVRPDGTVVAQAARASRKDLRDAVRSARGAFAGWSARTAYNRGQILYRVAELMEGRRHQFAAELVEGGASPAAAAGEVSIAIDRWVWYAGWADKIGHVLGTQNPVAGPYFAFTVPEPVGVVGLTAPDDPPLLGLVSRLAPALVVGNTVVALASARWPVGAVSLGEVLATSDVPGGVVNVLTGPHADLVPWLAGHEDVDTVDVSGLADDLAARVDEVGAEHVLRVVRPRTEETAWFEPTAQTPAAIAAFCEMKSVWHPMGP
jgi:acyl-CoA reductase-like NAD-dependent aldehyde dehydrogenase